MSATPARITRPVCRSARARRALVGAVVTILVAVAATALPAAQAQRDRSHQRADAANGLIAFVRAGKIWTVSPDGGQRTLLTPTGSNLRPHWSPDGTRLSYIHGTAASGWDVWVMNADGSDKQQVTRVGDVTEAQWSPNGQWLAFGPTLSKVRSTAPFGDPIPILGDLGGGPQELQVDGSLDWSVDGNIAYYSHEFPDSPDNYLLVLDIDTQEVSEWNGVGGFCCGEGFFGNPAWTPNGAKLAYDLLRYAPWDGQTRTRPKIQVDKYPSGADGGFTNARGNKDLDYAPDGTQVVFSHIVGGKLSVQVANRDGSDRHRLVKRGFQADWQPVISQT